MNIMDKTPAKITLHIDGMTWEQVREMIEERYGALMWDHKSTAYPTDSVVVRMAFAEPAGNVAQRAIGKAAPQQEAQEPVAWANWKVGSTSYVPHRTREQAVASVNRSEIAATQEGPYEVVALYREPQPSPASQGDALDAVAAEREACAQECLRQAGLTVPSYDTAVACAAAIRARAAQEGK